MHSHNSSKFKLKVIIENGYPRLNCSSTFFRGRIRIRLGKESLFDSESLQYELNKHFEREEITLESVGEYLKNFVSFKIKKNASIFDLFDEFVNFKKESHNKFTKKLFVKSSINAYILAKEHFQSYLVRKKIPPHPDYMNKQILDDFFYSIKLGANTRVKLHGKIKAYFRFLEEHKNILIDKSYKLSSFTQEYDNQQPKDDDIALNSIQVKKLMELRKKLLADGSILKMGEYPKNMMNLQRNQYEYKKSNFIKCLDCFLFMIGTGQYFSDIIKSKLEYKKTLQLSYLNYRRAKNNTYCKAIPVLENDIFILKTLIEKYSIMNGTNFPLNLSLTHFNKHLCEIGKIAGFNFKLKNKMARKTFASIHYFELNTKIEHIQIMLGHKSSKHTYHYLRIDDDDLALSIFNSISDIHL